MRKKIIISILLFVLIISAVLNVFLIIFTIKIYRQQKKFQIDPSNSLQYHELNKNFRKKSGNVARVVLFGDSRMYQWDPLPELSGCEFINRGIPGDTTSQSLLRIESDLISLNPDIVIIEIGVNDCNSIGVLPGLKNFIVTSCKNNINKIINILKKKKIKMVFLTVFPVGSVYPHRLPLWSDTTREAIKDINTFILQYNSASTRVVNCDNIFLEGKKIKKDYANDMLHLNRNGYIKLNDYVKPYLVKLVKDIKKRD